MSDSTSPPPAQPADSPPGHKRKREQEESADEGKRAQPSGKLSPKRLFESRGLLVCITADNRGAAQSAVALLAAYVPEAVVMNFGRSGKADSPPAAGFLETASENYELLAQLETELLRGAMVITDSYVFAHIAHGSRTQLKPKWCRAVYGQARAPDVMLVLAAQDQTAQEGWVTVDDTLPPDELRAQLWAAVQKVGKLTDLSRTGQVRTLDTNCTGHNAEESVVRREN
jgi:hypothetical protein